MNFKQIEEKLLKNTNSPYIQGDHASSADQEAFEAVKKQGSPNPSEFPESFAWF